ncbi:MAG: DciA family protein [Acidobacteriota bacterium]
MHDLVAPAIAGIVRAAPRSAEKTLFAWRVAVGQALARLTRIRLDDDGVLTAELDDARWAKELERSSPIILGRLREMLGADQVRLVRIVGPAPPRSDRRRPRGTTR